MMGERKVYGLRPVAPPLLLPNVRSRSNLFPPGSVYLLTGELRFLLLEGRASAVARAIEPGETIAVPRGRQIPVETAGGMVARVHLGPAGQVRRMPGRTVPREWEEACARAVGTPPKTVLVLGGTDTGKTFFVTYLANRLTAAGRKTAVLDADPGQPAVGPPGTLGYAVVGAPVLSVHGIPADGLYFTGTPSPGASFLTYAPGLAALRAQAAGAAETVLVNTPGWITGEGGRALTRAIAELVSPDLVVLLERGGELGYVAARSPGGTVVRLPVPEVVPETSAALRKELRERSYARYFREASVMDFPFRGVATERCYVLTGEPRDHRVPGVFGGRGPLLRAEDLGVREGMLVVSRRALTPGETAALGAAWGGRRVRVVLAGAEENLLVGLADAGGTLLALGILRKALYRSGFFRVLTPLPPAWKQRVRVIQAGAVRVTPAGREAGPVEPGSW